MLPRAGIRLRWVLAFPTALAPLLFLTASAGPAQGGEPPRPPPLPLPPQLQALEERMEQLAVNSERYALVTRIHTASTEEIQTAHGLIHRVTERKTTTQTATGDASISPARGELFRTEDPHRASSISIGSSEYEYSAAAGRRDGGRPWVLSKTEPDAQFPYHDTEIDAGGRGPYAGLINLLTTPVTPIRAVGQTTVRGQTASEFVAMVNPAELVDRLPSRLLEIYRRVDVVALTLFVSEAGVPLRVDTLLGKENSVFTEIELLALNVPVHVNRPPAKRTIRQAELNKILKAGSG